MPPLFAGSIGAAYAAGSMKISGFVLGLMLNGYLMPGPLGRYLFVILLGTVLALCSFGLIGARPWARRGLVFSASVAAIYEMWGALQFIASRSGEIPGTEFRGHAMVIALLIASAVLAASKTSKRYVAEAHLL